MRDQAVHAGTVLDRTLPAAATDVANRARGVAAEVGARLRGEAVSNRVLVDRVRSAMGRAVSHPHALNVRAVDGCVTLSGPVLASEEERLLSTVSGVRGVRTVENCMERHMSPGDIPSLQGGRSRSGGYGWDRENWPPTTRLLAGAVGGCMVTYGLGLLARATTNLPVDRLTGMGAGRRAIEFEKAINVNAPVEEVFAFCSMWENFPRFMTHVREVRGSGQQSHWVVDGPAGVPVSWDACVTEFVPNRLLAWKSLEGSAIQHAGIMRFHANANNSTRISIRMAYNPPAGALGHAVAKFFGADPKRQMDEDFNRLKSLIEAGKTSTPEAGEVTRDQLAA